jgi:hypothetical protein
MEYRLTDNEAHDAIAAWVMWNNQSDQLRAWTFPTISRSGPDVLSTQYCSEYPDVRDWIPSGYLPNVDAKLT